MYYYYLCMFFYIQKMLVFVFDIYLYEICNEYDIFSFYIKFVKKIILMCK